MTILRDISILKIFLVILALKNETSSWGIKTVPREEKLLGTQYRFKNSLRQAGF